MPDGGFALAFGDDVERGGGERSEDACLFPVQTLASLWASAGVVAGAVCPAADREVPGAEAALSVEACAIRSGVPAEGAGDSLVPVIAEAGGPTAAVARWVPPPPQPEDGFAAAGNVGSEGIGADVTARGERLRLASVAEVGSEPDGAAAKGTPSAPGKVALVARDKGTVTPASGSAFAQGDFAVSPPMPVSFPPDAPVEAMDWGKVASPSLAPLPVKSVTSSPETGLDADLPILPDRGETVSRPGIPEAAPIVAPQGPVPGMPGSGSVSPPLPTGAIPDAANDPTRMSAAISVGQRLKQVPGESEREPIPVLARPEDAQPQQPGFWERFLTGFHPASIAGQGAKATDLPEFAPMAFPPEAPGNRLVDTPVLQSDAGLVLDPGRQPTGQAAPASPALPITAAQAPEAMPVSADPVTASSLGQEPDTDSDPVLAAFSPGLLVTPGQRFTGAPQPVSLPVPQVASQIAAGLSRSPEGTTELALSPEELGHVRLKLKPDAANPDRMVVMITFERPETLDLFRRHAGDLTEALRTAGYAGVDIGFGQEGGGASKSDRPQHASSSGLGRSAAPDSTNPIATTPSLMAGASLDLRL